MITWKKKQIPCLYLLFYKLMKEKAVSHIFISYSSVKEVLMRRIHNIPKTYHYLVLKEMEELGMIKKVGNKRNLKYEFVGKDIDKLLNQYTLF